MTARNLDKAINDLTSTLGDPTRRSIYLSVRGSDEPLTAAKIAKAFGIHPNVARHHLDRLTEEGYLEVTRRRLAGKSGPGAGRPAKCYEATDKEIDLQFPQRRYDLVIDLLVRTVLRLSPEDGITTAREIGSEFGRALADGLGADGDPSEILEAIAALLRHEGFDITADPASKSIVTHHCPFGASKFEHPAMLCALDEGIMSGVLEAVGLRGSDGIKPHVGPDHVCVTSV